MQQRKSSARQKAVGDAQRGVAQPLARAGRSAVMPAAAPAAPPSAPRSGSGETTLGGHVDRGLTLASLYDIGVLQRLRLEVRLRLISDLTQSLAWLHANPRLMASHPHLVIAPSTVVIGLDGVARIDVRAAKKKDAERDPREQDYIAPEVLAGESGADLRADIYSVGVLAWEALAGARIGGAEHFDIAPGFASDDVPLALQPPSAERDPLRRRAQPARAPNQESQSRLRFPPPVSLPESAAWARPLAELALKSLCGDVSERVQDCRPWLLELEAIAPFLATTQEIAEVIQGISEVETLCIPAPTLPDADSVCQPSNERLGFMDRLPCQDTRGPVCAQRQRPTVHRVEMPVAVEREPAPPPLPSVVQPRRLPAARPRVSGAVWVIAGVLVLGLLGSIAGFVFSSLAAH